MRTSKASGQRSQGSGRLDLLTLPSNIRFDSSTECAQALCGIHKLVRDKEIEALRSWKRNVLPCLKKRQTVLTARLAQATRNLEAMKDKATAQEGVACRMAVTGQPRRSANRGGPVKKKSRKPCFFLHANRKPAFYKFFDC